MRTLVGFVAFAFAAAGTALAQGTLSAEVKAFVRVDHPVVALTHVRVIDGTGAPARADQTVVIRDGRLAALGDTASTAIPEGAELIDLSGRSVLPGYVMLYEHLFYPAGRGRCETSRMRARWSATGRPRALPRSRPTCTSAGPSSELPSRRCTSAASRSLATCAR